MRQRQTPEQRIDELDQRIHLIKRAITVVLINRHNGKQLAIDHPCHIWATHHHYAVPCVSPEEECLGCCLYKAHLTLPSKNEQL